MGRQYVIDGLRFKLGKAPTPPVHPDISFLTTSTGKIRLLDTREGKETILIIPDGPNVIEHYFPQLEKLRAAFRVVIFDLPGFGFSTHTGSYDYSYSATNALILEILDYIGIESVNIVFPCSHGFFGLAFTQAYPEMVKNLVLVQTPSIGEMTKWTARTVPGMLKVPYIGQMIMPFVEKKFAHKWYNYALPKGVDRAPYQDVAVNVVKQGGCFCLCSLAQGLMANKQADLTIDPSIPTTLVHGLNDFTHKGTRFETIREYQPKTEIISFDQCGHFPDLEKPKLFYQLLTEKLI